MPQINWFGGIFKKALIFLVAAQLLSYICYWLSVIFDLNSIVVILIALIVAVISVWKLEYGVYIAVAELFTGGQGHLFDLVIGNFTVSIRMAIFAVVMLAWLITFFRKRLYVTTYLYLKENYWLCLLAVVCAWGVAMAIIDKNSFGNIFSDFNAWIYFLYFSPFVTAIVDKLRFEKILQIFSASLIIIALKTLFYVYVLAHKFTFGRDLYKWGRDTRFGEFFHIGGGFYRIFAQIQIYSLIALFIFGIIFLLENKPLFKFKTNWRVWSILILSLTTVLISLSRSFWVGGALAVVCAVPLLFLIINHRFLTFDLRFLIRGIKLAVALVVASIALTAIVARFPLPATEFGNTSDAFFGRFNANESAVSSRGSQLQPLAKAIAVHPVVGSGWGSTVTYKSFDPRVIAQTVNGWYTTYAFEWGYLDMILKIGIFGLLVYLLFLFSIFKRLFQIIKQKRDASESALLIGFMLGLISILGVHMFSPYLNHPLGIGYILLCVVAINVFRESTPKPELSR